MEIYWCRKHGFCPVNGTLNRCLAQNYHQGCVNLIKLPTEHPKDERRCLKRQEKRHWQKQKIRE